MHIFAAIQAGGRSVRMGTDKAWVELAGQPLLESVLKAAQPLAHRLAIVISRDTPQQSRYQQLANRWKAELLYDPHDYCGPLGGIHTTLRNCTTDEAALILACDLPFITTDFLTLLAQLHETSPAPAITIPLDATGRRQMLAGIYHPGCIEAVEQLLAQRRLRVDGLCERLRVQEIDFSTYAHLPSAANLLNNLNTPGELHTAALVKGAVD